MTNYWHRAVVWHLMLLFVMAGLALVPLAGRAEAAASRDEVKALTLKAAEIVATRSLDEARRIFHNDTAFKHDEIYVNVIDLNGVWLVYPPRPAAEGQSVINVKDADGKALVQEIIRIAREQGEGWVEYRWFNPVSNRIEQKITFVERVAHKDMITYIGIYK
ncbi:MAG: cache domain-containing protein [Azospirillaceae bacterium]|nr:cache domain-containing protein [Azospirillaceae bacterium]